VALLLIFLHIFENMLWADSPHGQGPRVVRGRRGWEAAARRARDPKPPPQQRHPPPVRGGSNRCRFLFFCLICSAQYLNTALLTKSTAPFKPQRVPPFHAVACFPLPLVRLRTSASGTRWNFWTWRRRRCSAMARRTRSPACASSSISTKTSAQPAAPVKANPLPLTTPSKTPSSFVLLDALFHQCCCCARARCDAGDFAPVLSPPRLPRSPLPPCAAFAPHAPSASRAQAVSDGQTRCTGARAPAAFAGIAPRYTRGGAW